MRRLSSLSDIKGSMARRFTHFSAKGMGGRRFTTVSAMTALKRDTGPMNGAGNSPPPTLFSTTWHCIGLLFIIMQLFIVPYQIFVLPNNEIYGFESENSSFAYYHLIFGLFFGADILLRSFFFPTVRYPPVGLRMSGHLTYCTYSTCKYSSSRTCGTCTVL